MKKLALLPLLLLTSVVFAQTRDFTRWVNPFIGTGGHGHTFPGATLPFGMVQLSPDTRIDNWDGSSGYHYSDDVIYGFSHTHLSGTGIPDGCDILFMPTVGSSSIAGPSKFSHANERAEPGYYSVKLDQGGVFAELTATTRVGLHRYSFPRTDEANIVLDLGWRDRVIDSEIKVVGDHRLEGFRRSSSWAKDQAVYFVAQFSKPFKDTLISDGRAVTSGSGKGTRLKAVSRFSASDGEKILIKVAISFVSIDGARKNLEAEVPGLDFDKVRADAKATWNKELSKIEVSGGTDDQTTIFYTALYHTMIHPNVFNDVDGKYVGHDRKVHSLRGGDGETRRRGDLVANGSPRHRVPPSPRRDENHYTVFSLWDTFRAAHPLYTIIDQKRTVDFINTFIRIYEQGGRLPVWELWGEETDTMIGYHAVSVIADAMSKGIEGFDYETAYEAAKQSAELDHFGLAAYKKRGYISSEDDNESVSKTLEYAYDDSCITEMAQLLAGRAHDARTSASRSKEKEYLKDFLPYLRRARYFENLFDPATRFFRPKRNGGFLEPFAPNEVTFHFTEGNSWQYSFFIPHDVGRLIELNGGRDKFAARLDALFTTDQKLIGREQPDITGLIGQYAHGNEPSHHIPYLYDYAGQPWKTQKYVRQIMNDFYKNAPDGLIGNEDCGQMSAWFVFSALGFYPVAPGTERYDLGSPLFPSATINLESGKKLTISTTSASQKDLYIKAVKINGRPNAATYINHSDIMDGGAIEVEMTDQPAMNAFTRFSTSGWTQDLPTVPVIKGERNFRLSTEITMTSFTPESTIYFTTDGTEPTRESLRYTGPFTIRDTTTIRAIATKEQAPSRTVQATFHKRPNDWTVKVVSPYSHQYTGGGDDAIIDGLRGNANFAAGEWQGYQGTTFEAVIDLQRETEIKSVGGSFLQVVRSWIWMPDRVEFETSSDGVNFTRVAEIRTNFSQEQMEPATKEFTQSITPTRARYVRVHAYNIGKIPSWHPGAGADPWIFVDEIFVR